MRKSFLKNFILVAIIASLLVTHPRKERNINAQTTCAKITITVTDRGGSPASGYGVKMENNGYSKVITTNDQGIATFTHPVPGTDFILAPDANVTIYKSAEQKEELATAPLTSCEIEVQLPPQNSDIRNLVSSILIISITLGGIIALIRIIIGGYKIMGSGGDPISLQEGKDMVVSSILGLLVIIFSVTILKVIGSNILGIIKP